MFVVVVLAPIIVLYAIEAELKKEVTWVIERFNITLTKSIIIISMIPGTRLLFMPSLVASLILLSICGIDVNPSLAEHDMPLLRSRRNEKEMKVKPATSFKLLTIFIYKK